MDTIIRLLGGLAGMIRSGAQAFIAWLFSLAVQLTSWLPNHPPIDWPDPATFAILFRGLGPVGRFVDLPLFFSAMGVLLLYQTALLLYMAYRAILGFVPMAK